MANNLTPSGGYVTQWPYSGYTYPASTTTIVEETCEYDDKGKLIKKTKKTTTTYHNSGYTVTHGSTT